MSHGAARTRRLVVVGAAALSAVLSAARSGLAFAAGERDHMAHLLVSGQPLLLRILV